MSKDGGILTQAQAEILLDLIADDLKWRNNGKDPRVKELIDLAVLVGQLTVE